MAKDIGEFIQEIRKDKGLTQKELAEQVGISDKTISKWENGNSIPDTSMLLPLCRSLDITVNELLSCEKISPENYPVKAEENIMYLIKENEITKKSTILARAGGIITVCIALVLTEILYAGISFPLQNYFDLQSLILVTLLELGIILTTGARTKEKFLHAISKTIIPVGATVALIYAISSFSQLEDYSTICTYVSVFCAILLYSVIVKTVVEIITLAKE
ncbi:helix-turn-helix domain-containing protein [Agathobacter sp.]